ncbi:kinase-like domain-containing protein [Phaeosphaeria sp. MPI-PUGE-AT-0046c]|nr:kinase-like domain-containing protein [Phaeosphaeria sp. MPI-PUGE-AT-0046c]
MEDIRRTFEPTRKAIGINHPLLDTLPKSTNFGNSPTWGDYVAASDTRSIASGSTYYSALSRTSARSMKVVPGGLRRDNEYARVLQSEELWPVPFDIEQNWSGRGQHAEFKKGEEPLINSLLQVQDTLGHTRTAFVQSVKCKRILLARKTITCGKNTMTKEEAIKEVAHLTRLNHAHIVRIIGTYVKGRELSILLYPVAKFNLGEFFDRFSSLPNDACVKRLDMYFAGVRFHTCLSSALHYIHNNLTKHMDIKPQNILVEESSTGYRPYIADFGIARHYEKHEDIETDGHISFTRRYAAPEVVNQDTRGLPADIFSLGCVFLEIHVKIQSPWDDIALAAKVEKTLETNITGDRSYQANIVGLQEVLAESWEETRDHLAAAVINTVQSMLVKEPQKRPSAEAISKSFQNICGSHPCCIMGQVSLMAM